MWHRGWDSSWLFCWWHFHDRRRLLQRLRLRCRLLLMLHLCVALLNGLKPLCAQWVDFSAPTLREHLSYAVDGISIDDPCVCDLCR